MGGSFLLFDTGIINPNLIFMPVFALVTLTFLIAGYLGFLRNKAVMAREVSLEYFKLMIGNQGSETMTAVSRNYSNLFESTVLFYAVVAFAYVTNKVDFLMVLMAWGYVVCRYVHTVVHIGSNNVRLRFTAFLLSLVFLGILWIRFGLMLQMN